MPDTSEALAIAVRHHEAGRLTTGFLLKIENLKAAMNLHMADSNFCWRPGEMRVTPAQAAELTDHCWTFDELLA